MRIGLPIFCAALICSANLTASNGRSWYVDCANGADNNDGLSQTKAWKSVEQVSRHVFHAGDSILFRRGSVCTGMLTPKGSGSAGAPIQLDAWGEGPLPKIQAARGQEAAFKLFDQEYWTIRHLDFSGGQPHGVFISGSKGVLHGIHIHDILVHDVTGDPKNKEEGLLVIASGTEQQHFDDVLIDGVTAYETTQWAGILVGGVAQGFQPEESRNTNIVIRNSIAHSVAGDGIVLFQVDNGLIENSAAWETGMQNTQTIGTPNAIWTWMCRDCVVRRNEAFLTDSPGVDGGAFDIDYGNKNNTVEENYGHDTQGYCVAVFGAGWTTSNSVVRNNVCVANGLSPRLAKLQGALFLTTWNDGKIGNLQITGNRIFWNPPLTAAAIVNTAEFDGKASFENNTIQSSSPVMVRSNDRLSFDKNSYEYIDAGRQAACEAAAGRGPAPRWRLLAFVSANEEDHESRGRVAMIESVHHQFPNLELAIIVSGAARKNLRYDWNTGDIPVLFDHASHVPSLVLKDPSGRVVWYREGVTPPGELGLALRSNNETATAR